MGLWKISKNENGRLAVVYVNRWTKAEFNCGLAAPGQSVRSVL